MKKQIMKKTAKIINFVAKAGGGPLCLGWTYQPPRPSNNVCEKREIKIETDKTK